MMKYVSRREGYSLIATFNTQKEAPEVAKEAQETVVIPLLAG